MAHFAKLDESGTVLTVNVVHNNELLDENGQESEAKGIAFLVSWSGGYPHWKQCSYNASFRKNFPGTGYTYDAVRDAFIPPCPGEGYTINESTCQWDAPPA